MGRRRVKSKAKTKDARMSSDVLPAPWFGIIIAACVLVGVTLCAYANSLDGAFVFDDEFHIEHNAAIRSLFPLSTHLMTRRPLVSLTLAMNYAVGGLEPYGYHILNLAIHLLAALTLFGVVRRTLKTPRVSSVFGGNATFYALAVAAVWAVHPLTTQSVTYVIQRGESMMGLFYLLTLYCAICSAESKKAKGWFAAAAVLACFFGMATKAVMVTAPIVVLLYDRIFLSDRLSDALRKRWPLYAGLAACWLMLAATGVMAGVFASSTSNATVGFGYKGVTPLQYLATQPGVILHYLSLSLWPAGLCLDYNWPVAAGVARVGLPGVAIVCLLLLTVWALKTRPALGFLGAWFFLILAPTSSFIPIRDMAFEHRMYLPLVAIACLFVFGLRALTRFLVGAKSNRAAAVLSVAVLAVCVVALVVRTRARNADYRTEFSLWSATAAMRPSNARAVRAIGDVHFDAGRFNEAIKQYEKALQLNKGESGRFVYERLGTACQQLGRYDEAEWYFKELLKSEPDSPTANYNLGNLCSLRGQLAEAIKYYQRAVAISPDNAEAYINMGLAIAASANGDPSKGDEALAVYEMALQAASKSNKPAVCAKACYNSGLVLIWQGHVEQAIKAFEQVLQFEPNNIKAKRQIEEAQRQLKAVSSSHIR